MKNLKYLLIALSFISTQSLADNYIKILSNGNMSDKTFYFSNKYTPDYADYTLRNGEKLITNLVSDSGTLFSDYLSVMADDPDNWECADKNAVQEKRYYKGRFFEQETWSKDGTIPSYYSHWLGKVDSFMDNVNVYRERNPMIVNIELSCYTNESHIDLVLYKTGALSETNQALQETIIFEYKETRFGADGDGSEGIVLLNRGFDPERIRTGRQKNFAYLKFYENDINDAQVNAYNYSFDDKKSNDDRDENNEKLKRIVLKQVEKQRKMNELLKLK